MKDPLHSGKTAYDVLEIDEKAAKPEINQAFKRMLVSGGDTAEISEARNVLTDPDERAFVDIFLYEDTFLSRVKPSVKGDREALTSRRMNTMGAWDNILVKSFPNFAPVHCLSVLWYWWCIHCEEGRLSFLLKCAGPQVEGELPDVRDIDALWKCVIAGWALIISNEAFLGEWASTREGVDLSALALKLESHFKNLFYSYGKKYRDAGYGELGKVFEDYWLKFFTEVNTGRSLFKQNIKVNRGNESLVVSGGRILINKIGLTNDVLKEIERLLKNNPGNEMLKKLTLGLSEFGDIETLMQDKKFDEAIQQLEALPDAKKLEGEAKRLLVNALFEKGKILFNANQFDKAFEQWKKAVDACTFKKQDAKVPSNVHINSKRLEFVQLLKKVVPNADDQAAIESLINMKSEGLHTIEGMAIVRRSAVILNNAMSETDDFKDITLLLNEISSSQVKFALMDAIRKEWGQKWDTNYSKFSMKDG